MFAKLVCLSSDQYALLLPGSSRFRDLQGEMQGTSQILSTVESGIYEALVLYEAPTYKIHIYYSASLKFERARWNETAYKSASYIPDSTV